MKRRKAFKTSMAFLVSLTRQGNISEANKWDITKALFGKRQTNAMSQLGVFVAKQVLAYENDQGKAAAILLLVCLDFAYNAVVSVSNPRYFITFHIILITSSVPLPWTAS